MHLTETLASYENRDIYLMMLSTYTLNKIGAQALITNSCEMH